MEIIFAYFARIKERKNSSGSQVVIALLHQTSQKFEQENNKI